MRSERSVMRPTHSGRLVFLLGTALTLCACGGADSAASGSGAAASPGPTAPAAIQGIATPSNVAVVTATNAG